MLKVPAKSGTFYFMRALMTFNIQSGGKIGTCPHGMPLGACPICNGMGGGGSSSINNSKRTQGEMSWNECFGIGQMMKAAKANSELSKNIDQNNIQLQNSMLFKAMDAISNKLAPIFNFIAQSPIGKTFSSLLDSVSAPIKNIANTLKNVMANITEGVKNTLTAVKEAIINIADKLAAIFGEKENALSKTVSDLFKNAKKKLATLFGFIDETQEETEETEEVKDEKRKIMQQEGMKISMTKMNKNPEEIKWQ